MKTAHTYLAMWERLSPLECRLIARTAWRVPLRTIDLSRISGLSTQKIRWISAQPSWERITIGDASRFRIACGITPANESRHVYYLKRTRKNIRGPLAHIDKFSSREKRRILKLMPASNRDDV